MATEFRVNEGVLLYVDAPADQPGLAMERASFLSHTLGLQSEQKLTLKRVVRNSENQHPNWVAHFWPSLKGGL